MTPEEIRAVFDRAMSSAAGYANRCRALLEVSKGIPAETFERLTRQHPSTLERDIEWADQDYQRAKADYEAFCQKHGLPAYAVYNED